MIQQKLTMHGRVETTRGRNRAKSQVLGRVLAVAMPHAMRIVIYKQKPKGRIKRKKKISLLFLCQSVLLLSILGDYSSVSFLSTCWQPAPINTYPVSLFFSLPLFIILKPSLSQIRVLDSKKITCHCCRDFFKKKYIFHCLKLYLVNPPNKQPFFHFWL